MKTISKLAVLIALGSAALSVRMVYASHEEAGTYEEGYDLGLKNGYANAERVYKKTVQANGCKKLRKYQDTLNIVTRTVKPSRKGGSFVAGFYRGYTDAIRDSVKQVRTECNRASFYDGAFPGQIFANVFCQAARYSRESLSLFEFAPIYDGWSSSEEVTESCLEEFEATVAGCEIGEELSELYARAQAKSCAASSEWAEGAWQ